MNKFLKLVAISDIKTAKDNRAYYAAQFQDPTNPFAKTVTRMFWQQKDAAGTPVWRGADPEIVKTFVGKTLPGAIVTKEVEDYQIGERTINTYTTVVLGSELDLQVFKAMGHPLKQAAVAEQVAEAELEIN